jgi:hypothetical protein
MSQKWGTCRECYFRKRLRKDGTIGRHMIVLGPYTARYCMGEGQPPVEHQGDTLRRAKV